MTTPSIITLVVAGILAAAVTLIGGAIALRLNGRVALLTAFGSGVIISVALLELVPEALQLPGATVNPFAVMTTVAFGFAGYLILDRVSALLTQERPDRRGHLAPALLTVHSAMDGLAIGLALQVSSEAGWLVLVGVLAHDFVDGANSVIISMADGASKKRARGWLIANSAAPGVGLIGASLATVPTNFLVGSLAVFAGGFLYVGASELLPRSRADSTPLRNGAATIAGFLAFYLVAQGK